MGENVLVGLRRLLDPPKVGNKPNDDVEYNPKPGFPVDVILVWWGWVDGMVGLR